MGTKNGVTRFAPFLSITRTWSCKVVIPPIPLPTITPKRVGSIVASVKPLISHASKAATKPYWENKSILFCSLRSKTALGSNSFTSPAKATPVSSESNLVILPIPSLPSTRLCQNSFTVLPNGVTAPMPVMTTLFILYLRVYFDYQTIISCGFQHFFSKNKKNSLTFKVFWLIIQTSGKMSVFFKIRKLRRFCYHSHTDNTSWNFIRQLNKCNFYILMKKSLFYQQKFFIKGDFICFYKIRMSS